MTKLIHDHLSRGQARIVAAPTSASEPKARHQVEQDRNFELPTGLYLATIAAYLGFLAIVGSALMAPALAIPLAICALSIVAGFGVPSIWTRLKGHGPEGNRLEPNDTRPLTAGQFRAHGIETLTGRLSARDATVQVLILPVLIVLWGLSVVIIAALV